MTNVPIANRPDVGTPEVVVIEATTNEQKHVLASTSPGGVLKELALARWRGSTAQVPNPHADERAAADQEGPAATAADKR